MGREAVIQIEGLKKQYKLGQIGGGTLQGDLQSWWARVRGKEDPNTKIGADQRSNGKTFMALNGIDLTVYRGEALGIIGHNGAGKSTLLKILSRVTAPTEGEVRLKGRVASMLEVGTGFNGEMTGRENIYMNGAILGMTKAEVDAKMEQIIDFSECREFIDTPVKRYSSGMYVKLAFSVAAHLDAEIMIMDEVLAVGDMKFQQKCLGRMGDAASQEGRTVLYVSHNMNTIRQLCTRCVVLDQGRVIFDGDVEEAIQIYLDHNRVNMSQEIDLSAFPHQGSSFGKPVTMKYFRFCDREWPSFRADDLLKAELDLQVDTPKENLCLRAIIYHRDEVPVCMGTTERGAIALVKGEQKFSLCLDTRLLAPGSYYLKLALYLVNDFGTESIVDVVDKAVWFEKEEEGTENQLSWLPRWWGHVRMPKIQISEKV